MFSVVGQTRQVPSQFDLSMTVPTTDWFELQISVLADPGGRVQGTQGQIRHSRGNLGLETQVPCGLRTGPSSRSPNRTGPV